MLTISDSTMRFAVLVLLAIAESVWSEDPHEDEIMMSHKETIATEILVRDFKEGMRYNY